MHSPEVNLNSKVVTFCRFEGSRSKSPEDSMEVEGIDDWKISRRKIAWKYPWQAWSSEVDSQMWTQSCLCIYCLAWGQKLPSVTHRSHKQYNFVQWRPKSKTNAANFHDILSLPMGRKSIWNRECQFQSLNQTTHHGNAAATDEGPWVQGHRCSQRRV